MLYVTIVYDQDVPNPLDNEFNEWKMLRVGRVVGEIQPNFVDDGLRWRLENGTAFWLSKFKQSGESWYLEGEVPPMLWHDFIWDGTSRAGILLVPEALWQSSEDECLQYARSAIQEYNDWLAKDCYYFSVDEELYDEEKDETLESGGGFIGDSGAREMMARIKRALAGREWQQAIGSDVDVKEFLERYGE